VLLYCCPALKVFEPNELACSSSTLIATSRSQSRVTTVVLCAPFGDSIAPPAQSPHYGVRPWLWQRVLAVWLLGCSSGIELRCCVASSCPWCRCVLSSLVAVAVCGPSWGMCFACLLLTPARCRCLLTAVVAVRPSNRAASALRVLEGERGEGAVCKGARNFGGRVQRAASGRPCDGEPLPQRGVRWRY
jgi:hypothetical protein